MSKIEQVELSTEVKRALDQMTAEFIREEGYITCEMSIPEKYVVATHEYIYAKNRELPSYGMWRVYMCETCIGHNDQHPYHVDIMVVDDRPQVVTDEISPT